MTTLVIGAALSGLAAARLLARKGVATIVHDDDPFAIAGLHGNVHGGRWDRSLLDGVDVVVTSPGVPEHAAPIQDSLAAGLPVWSEIELASREGDAVIGAVTATNGKTTVTEMAAMMLAVSGMRSAGVGNIGTPLSDVVDEGFATLVVETSSFQLRFIDRFHPAVAVLLNVAPDHLDWHGTFDAYLAAKARITENQGPDDMVIYDVDDPGATLAVARAASRRVAVSGIRRPDDGFGPVGGDILIGRAVIPRASLARDDPAFVVDLVAAGILAEALGAHPDAITEVAATYRPGRHRREVVGTWDGVEWVDDSKATNPHAAAAAIRAYRSVVLVAGGRDKGLDVSDLATAINLRHVVGIGEAGPSIVTAAARGSMATDIEDAVAIADRVARPGDTVLLAPGCASFDIFDSYGHRGDAFAAAVRGRKKGRVTASVARLRPARDGRHADEAATLAHGASRRVVHLLMPMSLLLVVGLGALLSASSVVGLREAGDSLFYIKRQVLWMALGVIALFVGAATPVRWWRRLANPAFGLTVLALVAVLVVGHREFGATRWLVAGPLSVQPSEIAKLSTILMLATVMSRRELDMFRLRDFFIPVMASLGVVSVLVMLEPDLGTTLLIASGGLAVLFTSAAPMTHVLSTAMLGGAAAIAAARTSSYRWARITAFLDIGSDPLGDGYQGVQSLVALGTGGLFGVGLGASRARWSFLPNAHTDFIFSIVGEETGLGRLSRRRGALRRFTLGGLAIARNAATRFGRMAAVGITTWLSMQALVNIGGAIGVLPITGVPLPFVSFGGTALVTEMAAVGLLVAVARDPRPQGQVAG